MKWHKPLIAFGLVLFIGCCSAVFLCDQTAQAIQGLKTGGKHDVGDAWGTLEEAQTYILNTDPAWHCYSTGDGSSSGQLADQIQCVKPATTDVVEDQNLQSCWIDKLGEEYQAYCGDKFNSAKAWGSSDDEGFMLNNCATTGSSLDSSPAGITVISSMVRVYDCSNFPGENDYCYYYNHSVSTTDGVSDLGSGGECFPTLAEAEAAGSSQATDDSAASSQAAGDTCGDSSLLGWLFCDPARMVTELVDTMITHMLIPMLQWRLVIP